MNLFILAREIRYRISEGDTRTAINLALKALKDNPTFHEIILHSADFNNLEEQLRKGLLDNRDARKMQSQINDRLLQLASLLEKKETRNTRIFISHSSRDPDQQIARSFHQRFKEENFYSFLAEEDVEMGQNWSRRIFDEIKTCDYFVLLLSYHSAESEMVTAEIKVARRMSELNPQQRPFIIPIRVSLPMEAKLNFDQEGYLEGIQQGFWAEEKDTTSLYGNILEIIKGNRLELPKLEQDNKLYQEFQQSISKEKVKAPLPKAAPILEEGGMALDSEYYIEREDELQYRTHITQDAAILRIKAPRQFGKTSFLARVVEHARQEGIMVYVLSFQKLNSSTLNDLDELLYLLCKDLMRTLKIRDPEAKAMFKEIWDDEDYTSKIKCTYFIQDCVLAYTEGPLLLALDEADRLFPYKSISTDFFAMLRSWNDSAVFEPIMKRIRQAIVYSTEVHLAIQEIEQSPFNIGKEIRLKSFDQRQTQALSHKYQLDWTDSELTAFQQVFGGHPYISRKAMYNMVNHRSSLEALKAECTSNEGPFHDHLKRMHAIISQNPELWKAMRQIAMQKPYDDELIIDKLRAAGLVIGDGAELRPAMYMYEKYFREKLR